MKAAIITIGDELLIGQTLDTNSAWMGAELSKSGFDIFRITSVHDRKYDIIYALNEAAKEADVVLVTGGLGPTSDDITKHALAEYFSTRLVMNSEVLQMIEEMMSRRNYAMNDKNRRHDGGRHRVQRFQRAERQRIRQRIIMQVIRDCACQGHADPQRAFRAAVKLAVTSQSGTQFQFALIAPNQQSDLFARVAANDLAGLECVLDRLSIDRQDSVVGRKSGRFRRRARRNVRDQHRAFRFGQAKHEHQDKQNHRQRQVHNRAGQQHGRAPALGRSGKAIGCGGIFFTQ